MAYTEAMFKNSKWTMFHETGCHGPYSPYQYVLIQAPMGVAKDVMRKIIGYDPDEITCAEHQSRLFSVSEDIDVDENFGKVLLKFSNTVSILTIRYDAIPYYDAGIWPSPITQWTLRK